ncbi:MAG: hypothetical protein IJ412_08970 [Oscillospiraceae bacterium]|nr:hypothetical protein [Oscillospiraceae bacterium]
MYKVFFVLAVIFTLGSFIGSGYIASQGGNVHPGYSSIPYLLSILCLMGYTLTRPKKKR